MTKQSEDILKQCKTGIGLQDVGPFYYGIEQENERLMPIIRALIEINEKFSATLEAVIDGDTPNWTIEQERIGNKAIAYQAFAFRDEKMKSLVEE